MDLLVDMHMHVGFAPSPADFARDLACEHIATFANTVTPNEYDRLYPLLGKTPLMRLGVGLHPWWLGTPQIANAHGALEDFERALDQTRFVGEIGLDFLPAHIATKETQLEIFEHIIQLCSKRGGYLISLHTVRAERELLDILEKFECFASCTIILHSFGGSSNQLTRAIQDGCLFSIGSRMLSTKRGSEYSRVIPQDRLLIESDLPDENDPISVKAMRQTLDSTITRLALVRNVERDRILEDISSRSKALLGI